MRGFILFVLMSWSAVGWGQQTDKFTVQFGGLGDDEGQKIIQTFDTGYAIIGSTGSFGNGSSDMYLLKLDKAGFLQWSKTFGGTNVENGYGIVQLKDSGYIVVGNTNSKGYGGYDGYIVRTNKVGDTIWTKTYGGADWDFLYDVKALSDSTFIAVGKTMSFGSGEYDSYLIKFNAKGDTLQTKTIGGAEYEEGKSIAITFDKKILVGGSTSSFGNGMKDFYINLLDENLDTIWNKTYGGFEDDVCTKVLQQKDSLKFYYSGTTRSYSDSIINNNFFNVKAKFNGDAISTIVEGGTDSEVGFGMCEGYSINIVWTGNTIGPDYHQVLLLQKDTNDNFQYQTSITGFSNDESIDYFSDGYDVISTLDSGFAIVGKVWLKSAFETNVYFIKTSREFVTSTSLKRLDEKVNTSIIYPNPFNEKIHFKINDLSKSYKVTIYDVLGNTVMDIILENGNLELNTNHLPKGFYNIKLIEFHTNKIITQKKLIKS